MGFLFYCISGHVIEDLDEVTKVSLFCIFYYSLLVF